MPKNGEASCSTPEAKPMSISTPIAVESFVRTGDQMPAARAAPICESSMKPLPTRAWEKMLSQRKSDSVTW